MVRFTFHLIALTLFLGGAARADEAAEILARVAPVRDTVRRIELISEGLLGRPYVGGPLGEGPDGIYDRDPIERLDAFDCTTFVETVTALSISSNREEYVDQLQRIRYINGNIDFTLRNHFPSADWIPNNIAAGFFEEITATIAAPAAPRLAVARIDKPNWYRKMTVARIQRNDLTETQKLELLEELRAEGEAFEPGESTLPYFALADLFDAEGGAIEPAFARIPSGAVVSIVRPGWDLNELIGTSMNVSHQGLTIRKDGVLYLRHASDAVGFVAEQPLTEYLGKYLASPTIKGIQLLEVRGP